MGELLHYRQRPWWW